MCHYPYIFNNNLTIKKQVFLIAFVIWDMKYSLMISLFSCHSYLLENISIPHNYSDENFFHFVHRLSFKGIITKITAEDNEYYVLQNIQQHCAVVEIILDIYAIFHRI